MAIERSMEVLDIVGDVMPEWTFERLLKKGEEALSEIEYEIELISFSEGRPAKMYMPNGDPGWPEEPAEFETTMLPEEVAGMLSKMVFSMMDDDDCTPKMFTLIWNAIYEAEKTWQDNNLDEAVYELQRG